MAATISLPEPATHWSAPRLAKEVGLGPAAVHRIWKKCGLQLFSVEYFKFSTDPEFESRLDIVGLYPDHPPEGALALRAREVSNPGA